MEAAGPLARWRGQIAPIAAISVFGLSISMTYPLLSLLLERMGVSGTAIGFNTMASAVATVLVAPILPRVMAVTGPVAMLVGSGLGLAALMLIFPLVPDFWIWMAMRPLYGAFSTAVFFASEYWIVTTAPDGARGRVIGVYTISLSVSFMVGPLVIGMTGIEGMLPFALGAVILVAGVLPTLWGASTLPEAALEAPPTPRATLAMFSKAPGMLWAVVLFGVVEFGAVALLPVWAVRSGFGVSEAALIAASFAAGSVVSAPLMGWAADRHDRRRLLTLVAAVSVAAPVAMIAAAGWLAGVVLFGMVWGAFAVGLYTLPLTELGARYSGQRLAEANGAVVLGYGLGALFAPAALGAAMDAVPPHGLLWAAGGTALAYLALIAARLRHGPPAS